MHFWAPSFVEGDHSTYILFTTLYFIMVISKVLWMLVLGKGPLNLRSVFSRGTVTHLGSNLLVGSSLKLKILAYSVPKGP